MAYKKVGGLHFFSLGRFGLTFYIKRHRYSHITADAIGRAVKRKANLERLKAAASMDDYRARFGTLLSEEPEFPDFFMPDEGRRT